MSLSFPDVGKNSIPSSVNLIGSQLGHSGGYDSADVYQD